MAARIYAVFFLITITASDTVVAQSVSWRQQPMPQQSYAAPNPRPSSGWVPTGVQQPMPQQAFNAPVQRSAGGHHGYTAQVAQRPQSQAIAYPTANYHVSPQNAPSVPFQPRPVQPYYVAAHPGDMPVPQEQVPVTPVDGSGYYSGSSLPQYQSAESWHTPAFSPGTDFNSPYCGGSCAQPSCYGTCDYSCCPTVQWFGSVGALMLDRDDENHRFYSYDSADESFQLLDSQQTNFSWGGGVEAHVGRMDLCTCCGCEAVYWGLYPDDGYAYVYPYMVAGDLNAIFNFDQLDYNGQTANNFTDGAAVHRLQRSTELHNVEFNHIWDLSGRCGGMSCCATGCDPCGNQYGYGSPHGGSCGVGGGGWAFRALAGFRYLRLEDNLQFASDPNDTQFSGEPDELYYTIDCDNDLWGFQLGGMGERALGASAFSLTCGVKAGVFVNDADAYSTIGGAAGLATINNGPNNGVAWNIDSHDDCIATIAELQAGLAYAFTPNCRIRGDYRVIGISGVALPTNQIYQDLRGVQDVALISTNGDLILHGVFVGLDRTY